MLLHIEATEMLSKFNLPIPDEEPHTICEDVFKFQPVTTSHVSQLIDELLLNKSPGIDKIPAKVAKDCKIHIVDRLSCGPTFPTFSYFFLTFLLFLLILKNCLIFLLFPTFSLKILLF